MVDHPVKALGIPYVGNKWAHMAMFRDALPGQPNAYLDLTFGCGICSIFMNEVGVRKFVCNDASPYPRLIAQALLGTGAKKLSDEEIRDRIRPRHSPGWAYDNISRKIFRHRTVAYLDAICKANRDCPLILVAIGSVISTGAMSDFRYGFCKHLTPKTLADLIYKKALRLNYRVSEHCKTRITQCNYLDVGGSAIAKLKDHVCYLDPAWPAQPEKGRKHVGNEQVYGFYAQKLMSVLWQADIPMPPEYAIGLDEFYVGMRDTVDRLKDKNTVLIAYQSRPDVVDEVKERIFDGLDITEFKEQRKSGTKLWEYLWRIE
jgi:hypothetical protein